MHCETKSNALSTPIKVDLKENKKIAEPFHKHEVSKMTQTFSNEFCCLEETAVIQSINVVI